MEFEKFKVSCLNCGATNNTPAAENGKKAVCGRCGAKLPVIGSVVELTPESLEILYQKGRLPLLIDFFSMSCAPCRMMDPVVQNLAERRKGELMAVKIDVDRYPSIAAGFGVQSVPTFIVFVRGNEIGRSSGAQSETDFALWMASLV